MHLFLEELFEESSLIAFKISQRRTLLEFIRQRAACFCQYNLAPRRQFRNRRHHSPQHFSNRSKIVAGNPLSQFQ